MKRMRDWRCWNDWIADRVSCLSNPDLVHRVVAVVVVVVLLRVGSLLPDGH